MVFTGPQPRDRGFPAPLLGRRDNRGTLTLPSVTRPARVALAFSLRPRAHT